MLNQKDADYDLRSIPGKYIDALDTLTTHNNMELIIVEAPGGQLKENTTHSIEDTLKILECGILPLRKEAAHYNDTSLSTFMKVKVYGVHVIKSQVTLSEISLNDETHWKYIELRSAKLPTSCSNRIGLVQYMELLATLYDVCYENQRIQEQFIKKNIGLISFSGSTIGSVVKDDQTIKQLFYLAFQELGMQQVENKQVKEEYKDVLMEIVETTKEAARLIRKKDLQRATKLLKASCKENKRRLQDALDSDDSEYPSSSDNGDDGPAAPVTPATPANYGKFMITNTHPMHLN